MFIFLKKNWVVALLILVVLITGFFALSILLKADYIYLRMDDPAPDLKGAKVITNNTQIGHVISEVQLHETGGRLFQIQFDKTINIPDNSKISIRKSAIDDNYAVFLTLIPSKNYLDNRDTLFVDSGNFTADIAEPEHARLKIIEAENILTNDSNDLQEPTIEEVKIKMLKPDTNLVKEKAIVSTAISPDSIYFMVQIFATKNPVNKSSPQFKGISPVVEILEDGFYKYFTGKTHSIDEVSESKNKLIDMGLPDAFVVAYQGNHRISVTKALSLKK